MDFIKEILEKAKKDIKTIVLPEGDEVRTIKAAEIIHSEKIAKLIMLGDEEVIKEKAKGINVNLEGITIIDPLKSEKNEYYANEFYELRKTKGMTLEKAREIIKDPMYFGTMMVKLGDGDGMVSGAVHSTGDLLRPGLQIIKTAKGVKCVSSFFLMQLKDKSYGKDGLLLFADCAVNPNPSAEDLASIAIATAENAKVLCDMEPKVAMLSFSTMGSAKNELVDKVVEATKIANTLRPDLDIDGELQLDAALVIDVAALKAPNSTVAGKANVLVFPDLQSGNIGYKLVQRLAGAEAIGPVCQGFAKPINDLSRGCNVQDIINVVAVTAVQSQN